MGNLCSGIMYIITFDFVFPYNLQRDYMQCKYDPLVRKKKYVLFESESQ